MHRWMGGGQTKEGKCGTGEEVRAKVDVPQDTYHQKPFAEKADFSIVIFLLKIVIFSS